MRSVVTGQAPITINRAETVASARILLLHLLLLLLLLLLLATRQRRSSPADTKFIYLL